MSENVSNKQLELALKAHAKECTGRGLTIATQIGIYVAILGAIAYQFVETAKVQAAQSAMKENQRLQEKKLDSIESTTAAILQIVTSKENHDESK